MTNFVYDDVPLPGSKTNIKPVTNASNQWSAEDANAVFTALGDIRTVIRDGWMAAKDFGVVGNGVADDTAALQAAITASPGRTLYLPKGKYKVTSTLLITDRNHRIVGDCGVRNSINGTEIQFFGTGPCIQIGTDNGHAWSASDYDGPQDQAFENIWISHGAPDSSMASNPGGASVYKAGAYGIWDWRAGGLVFRNVGFEAFEASFVGIQSDINSFINVVSLYSKFGLYIGPRSDQLSLYQLMSFSCDRALTIDGARQPRIVDAQFIGCGTTTAAAIEIRQGSAGVEIVRPWFEHLSATGYAGVDQLSFVSAGEVAGYGSGGSISSPGGAPVTASVEGCSVIEPMILTDIVGNPYHTKYAVSVGKCHRLFVASPAVPVGFSITNLDAIVGVQASQAPTNGDTQISIRDITSTLTIAKTFTNLGAGNPSISIYSTGPSGTQLTTESRFFFKTFGASAGADSIQLSQEGQVGEVWLTTPNKPSGQVTRLRLARSVQTSSSASAPSLGTVELGDRCMVLDPAAGGFAEWVCVVAGNPGTWCKAAPVLATDDAFVVGKGLRASNELAPAQITTNQNDYSPAGLVDAVVLVLTSSGAVNITGIATGIAGRKLWIYNGGAQNITLTNQDVLSVAGNRIIGRGAANTTLTAATAAELYYSPSLSRWIVLGDTL